MPDQRSEGIRFFMLNTAADKKENQKRPRQLNRGPLGINLFY